MARPKGSKNKATKAKPDKAPKKPKAAAPAAEAVKGSEVTGMITKSVLASLLALDKRTKKAQSELSGEIGQKVADAVERFGTNRKALATIRALNRMEPEKLADFLDHFDYMLDISGLEDRAAAVQRLPMGDTPAEADDEDGAGEPAEAAGEPAAEAGDDDKVSRPAFGRPAA